MQSFRRSLAPTAVALFALAPLLILPAIHGADAAHRGYASAGFARSAGGPQAVAPASPRANADAVRPCPLCLALSHSRAAAADSQGVQRPEAPLAATRVGRLPAQPGPFRLSLATLAPRAPPAAAS
jgi:hypothetical protein